MTDMSMTVMSMTVMSMTDMSMHTRHTVVNNICVQK